MSEPQQVSENAASYDVGPGPDGEKIVDPEYYQILGVKGNATDIELKKAYRKLAIKHHPDKGGDAETFQKVGEAYQVLADPQVRAAYNKWGKKSDAGPEVAMQDPGELFGQMFGGERFYDLIGEISLVRDLTKGMDIMMTDEEKEEMEREMRKQTVKEQGADTPTAEAAANTPAEGASDQGSHTGAAKSEGTSTPSRSESGTDLTHAGKADKKAEEAKKKAAHRMTPEQKKKLEEFEREKEKATLERIKVLSERLKDRIRPFVEAKNPGDKDDPETILFEKKQSMEAEDLKLESFGVELLHTIGNIYITKATTWIKSRRSNFLGLPGFFSKLKEKGAFVKETWGLLGSAISVQMSMEDLQKRQERGDVDEEELKILEADMTGKMLLATWRGTRMEVGQVLRAVCDSVLNERGVPEPVLLNRAKALVFLGAIFKQVQPDESDEERRELERLVAEAGKKKDKKKDKKNKYGSKLSPSPPDPSSSAAAVGDGKSA